MWRTFSAPSLGGHLGPRGIHAIASFTLPPRALVHSCSAISSAGGSLGVWTATHVLPLSLSTRYSRTGLSLQSTGDLAPFGGGLL